MRRAVQKTVYPLDYNRNNPAPDFNSWSQYIRDQVHGKRSGLEFMQSLIGQVNQIINQNK